MVSKRCNDENGIDAEIGAATAGDDDAKVGED